jgi:hypothetical protein
VVAGKIKNESLVNSESTGGICRFEAIIVGLSGGAGRRAGRTDAANSGGTGPFAVALVLREPRKSGSLAMLAARCVTLSKQIGRLSHCVSSTRNEAAFETHC